MMVIYVCSLEVQYVQIHYRQWPNSRASAIVKEKIGTTGRDVSQKTSIYVVSIQPINFVYLHVVYFTNG